MKIELESKCQYLNGLPLIELGHKETARKEPDDTTPGALAWPHSAFREHFIYDMVLEKTRRSME